MSLNVVTLLYLVVSVCFIQALKGLSNPKSARAGNVFGMAWMAVAIRSLEGSRNAHSGYQCLWALTATATWHCCLSVSMAPDGFVERRCPKKQKAKLAPMLVECAVDQDADPVTDSVRSMAPVFFDKIGKRLLRVERILQSGRYK